ncbi:FMN-dependent NADH-azoreductase [Burkholderia ubonensis]|uniref:FMN-dependent NADH-azoreductase n=1 Tax=Burkholderia ubonensis TaxID=101571 RepID=UPI000756BE3E|nr:NAD(P)H-dependent oxidoreductase [Burkholderia ubonensis]KVO81664.1 FMN-dependent NADH-azoreductase [Burkholderia ubonensis]KVP72105.1 FMN-dependent NADH-azoreductase [Burkholderia ubonensis]KVZ04731.1 FMN-dependent NADH-azoreductase [Burkholderia ubonensis]KWC12711.1 FMN-dependent NADH-azoreductase [Burkholderia ubonensis]KWE85816.1 FMN-dependent NADH-azoreductase [Burkholderia ubonensis]
MARLLYIECSPRKCDSASIDICRAFLDAYREAHPADTVDTLDVWNLALPEFDGDAMAAKYAGLSGAALTPAQASAWARIEALAAPFHAADKLLFGIPLWNFGIPYKLKHLIDVISQKDVLFTFDGTGFAGKLAGRKAAVVYARGLDYASPGSFTPAREYDLQRPYVETWLKFVGVTDVQGIVVEKTLLGDDGRTGRRAAAEAARALARDF